MILTALLCAVLLGDGESARELVEAAQLAMNTERFEDAMDLYEQAGVLMPDAAEIPFNMGVAAYRAGDFERASTLFDRAGTLASDPLLQAQAAYNLGTTSAQQAISSRTDDPAVAQAQMEDSTASLKTALEKFRDAIAMNPDDEDARANGELAWQWLKQLEQLQDQMQQDGQQQQEQDDGEPQDQDQQQQQQPGEQEQSEDQQPGGSEQEQEQEQEQQQQEQPSQSDEQQQEQEQGRPSSTGEKPMSREEAERLLQSVRDKEAQRREELARQEAGKQRPVEKDW
jgi:Ca-activated chloride channel family protein